MSNLHPLTQFLRKTIAIFTDIGYGIVQGPQIETEWYNFDALNMFADHPARDIQDTFWLTDGRVLRTHTSAVQVRSMENRTPPVKIIVPGVCFRHEATDQTHETLFFQLEGFCIDRNISMVDLISTLSYFAKKMYGEKIQTRFVPHYYPFTEPSMDMHIKIGEVWMEMLGSGMIHPKVLQNMGVDPEKFSGFAFGLGIDRLAMKYWEIDDIRLFYNGDIRFLKQF